MSAGVRGGGNSAGNSSDDLSALKVRMSDQLKLQEERVAAIEGHYERWDETHETVMNESRWTSAKSLVEFLDHIGNALGETSCQKVRLSLISEIEEFLTERCLDGRVIYGAHKRFPENQHVRSDDDFWKTNFDQIIKCLRCCGISDADREFFLEQRLAVMMSRVDKAAVSRKVFEGSNNLLWRNPSSGESLSEFEKEQRVLQLHKALLDLRVFKQDFNNLIAKIEARVNRALKTLEKD